MSAQPTLAARPDPRPLRLGFVGLGWIGRRRLDTIASRDDVRVIALADSDQERLCASHNEYPEAFMSEDFAALLELDLDGVVIATPNASHAEQAIECLQRGMAVFCQKPLAINAQQCERVLAAAAAANRLLSVDYSYRHVQGMQALQRRIRAGELGRVLAIDLIFHNAYGPNKQWCFDRARSGGGCLLDLGVHLIDLARWLQNNPAMDLVSSRLYSRGRIATQADVEDLAFVEFKQDDGAIVRLACSWNAQIGCDAQIGAHVHATEGGARWRNVRGSFVDFELDLLHGNSRESLGVSRDDWGPGALNAWLDRLRSDRSFDASAHEILDSARLLDQAYSA